MFNSYLISHHVVDDGGGVGDHNPRNIAEGHHSAWLGDVCGMSVCVWVCVCVLGWFWNIISLSRYFTEYTTTKVDKIKILQYCTMFHALITIMQKRFSKKQIKTKWVRYYTMCVSLTLLAWLYITRATINVLILSALTWNWRSFSGYFSRPGSAPVALKQMNCIRTRTVCWKPRSN